MAVIPWSTPSVRADEARGASAASASSPPAQNTPVADRSAVVMASRFVVRSRWRHAVPMLRNALKVRRALLATPGALGVSLDAHPLRGEYWTLSGWTDRAALDAFVRTPVHHAAMRALGPAMADATFVFWAQDAAAPTWPDARARVAAERSATGGGPDA